MTVSIFLLALGAALRLTRLGTEDSITQPFRNWLAAKASADRPPDPSWTGPQPPPRTARAFMWAVQLFECPWCLGFWASTATVTLAAASDGDGWFLYPALALTVSYLVGAIATIVYTIEEI